MKKDKADQDYLRFLSKTHNVKVDGVVVGKKTEEGEIRSVFFKHMMFYRLQISRTSRVVRISNGTKKVHIETVPGSKATILFSFLLPTKAFELFIEPVIADEQYEYIEALNNKQEIKAKWIKVRVWLLTFYAFIMIMPSRFTKALKSIISK